jgi:hypothetical protein
MASISTSFLFLVNISQFILIFVLIYKINSLQNDILHRDRDCAQTIGGLLKSHDTKLKQLQLVQSSPPTLPPAPLPSTKTTNCEWNQFKEPKGVAITLMLHTPAWFQRRYTMMIQNAHENIPDDWVVQVFYTGEGQSLSGLTMNRGIQKLIDIGRVRLTVIPPELFKKKKRKIELITDVWLWQNVLAEKVLVFGGTAVICSNSPQTIQQYLPYDFIGAPWNAFRGVGGDGGISIRSRSWMVKAIEYELDKHTDPESRANCYKKWGQEDHFFVSRLLEMHRKGLPGTETLRISTRNESMMFAAVGGWYHNDVWAVNGILPDVPFKERDKFMQLCPEMKMFYPSLHDPSCFGASPDGEKCALSICALKPKTERRGGC